MELVLIALTTFVLIVPVELPDKTFIATLVLSTRFPHLAVWLGVVAAFGVQCAIAVGAGHLISALPQRPVSYAAAALFAAGAVLLAVRARRADAEGAAQEREYGEKLRNDRRGGLRAAATSFVVLFTAEWGDLSQLLAVSLVASGKSPWGVFFGAWAALSLVSGVAVLSGRWLLARVRLSVVTYVGAAVCAVLAVVTAVTA
ncbi:MAG TPA: TMEM165/GDT1 family protein [Pilimelia sp.]|nr:TMEM165/GDT1 family protein [Pilimelia sp.]